MASFWREYFPTSCSSPARAILIIVASAMFPPLFEIQNSFLSMYFLPGAAAMSATLQGEKMIATTLIDPYFFS